MFDTHLHTLCGECGHIHYRTALALGITLQLGCSANQILRTAPCAAPGACRLKPGKGFQPVSARLRAMFASRLDLPAHARGVTRTGNAFDPSDPIACRAMAGLVTATVRRNRFALPPEIPPADLITALNLDLGLTA